MAELAGDRIARMRALTRQAHAGQTRNGGRVPYWIHTDSVADICRNAVTAAGEPVDAAEDLVLAAYGHDLYEDTAVPRESVRGEFGERVDGWIAALTNERGDADREQYLRQLAAAADEVRVIKCADLVDNLLSVSYGLHDLGLPWVRGFFWPIAVETRELLLATPFIRLPRTGGFVLNLVDWAWARLGGSMESASGQAWAEDVVTDPDDGSAARAEAEELRRRLTLTPEEAEMIREKRRRETEEQVRRLWGDQTPFPIPDTDTDA